MRQTDVQHVGVMPPQIVVGIGAAAGDRLEGKRRDELSGSAGEDHVYGGPGLGELAGEIGSLVAGNAAGDAEDDALSVERVSGHSDCGLLGDGPQLTLRGSFHRAYAAHRA